jgi:hypothetical protein
MPAPTLTIYEKQPNPVITPVVAYRPDGDGGFSLSEVQSSDAGMQPFRNTAASNTPLAVKASAGNIYELQCINTNPNTVYLKFYNIAAAGVTVGTSTVRRVIPCPGGSVANPGFIFMHSESPLFAHFSTAIAIAVTANQADNDNTAPTTAVSLNLGYA